eukprot:TRINITY_DN16885_c0_g1_i1.p2 TRINITY_DN16885_c0_g1~~TRINITY_DN16885_c0_g1_i1.p2  ORF type:complete len:103 (+),score=13.58 TRINITY_DN16885_c0_g1_i1:36-311(+)
MEAGAAEGSSLVVVILEYAFSFWWLYIIIGIISVVMYSKWKQLVGDSGSPEEREALDEVYEASLPKRTLLHNDSRKNRRKPKSSYSTVLVQ